MHSAKMASLLVSLICFSMICGTTAAKKNNDYTILRLNGEKIEENVIFSSPARSLLHCGALCHTYTCCNSFTYAKKMCRGNLIYSGMAPMTALAPGARTFRRRAEPSWLGRTCTKNSDCPTDVDNVVCTTKVAKCQCEDGYYYSNCHDSCVRDCPSQSLQSTFLEYPKMSVAGYNIDTFYGYDKAACQGECLQNPDCRTFEIATKLNGKCNLQKVTALDQPHSYSSYADYISYQRTCL